MRRVLRSSPYTSARSGRRGRGGGNNGGSERREGTSGPVLPAQPAPLATRPVATKSYFPRPQNHLSSPLPPARVHPQVGLVVPHHPALRSSSVGSSQHTRRPPVRPQEQSCFASSRARQEHHGHRHQALPGRDAALCVGNPAVNGARIMAPFPEGSAIHVWLGCSGGPSASSQVLDGVVSTAVGYAGGFTQHPTYRGCGGRGQRVAWSSTPARSRGRLKALGGPQPHPGHAPGQQRARSVGDLGRHPKRRRGLEDGVQPRRHGLRRNCGCAGVLLGEAIISSTFTRSRWVCIRVQGWLARLGWGWSGVGGLALSVASGSPPPTQPRNLDLQAQPGQARLISRSGRKI